MITKQSGIPHADPDKLRRLPASAGNTLWRRWVLPCEKIAGTDLLRAMKAQTVYGQEQMPIHPVRSCRAEPI